MHYVWRKYLEAWSTNEQIWCYRDKKIFHTNLDNVGKQRDFYKPGNITHKDILIFRDLLFIDEIHDELKPIIREYLEVFKMITDFQSAVNLLERQVSEEKISNTDMEEAQNLIIALHNFEEDCHTKIENTGMTYLCSIIKEDLSFFEKEEDHFKFLMYICLQYFRTKKMKKLAMGIPSFFEQNRLDIDTASGFMRWFGATCVAAGIFIAKGLWNLVLLRNQSRVPFITCDQPVINTYAYGAPVEKQVKGLEFYYPITPKLAVLLTQDKRYSYTDTSDIHEGAVHTYNALSVDASQEQIYGNERSVLSELLPIIQLKDR